MGFRTILRKEEETELHNADSIKRLCLLEVAINSLGLSTLRATMNPCHMSDMRAIFEQLITSTFSI